MMAINTAKAAKRVTGKPFDWVKYLIVTYVIVTGVWIFAAPFSLMAILAFTAGMITFCAHHKTASWINRRIQFWAYVMAGAYFGVPIAAAVWMAAAIMSVFVK